MKLFNKVLVDQSELKKLNNVKEQYKYLVESEKARHSRDKHAKLEATIADQDQTIKTITDERNKAEKALETAKATIATHEKRVADLVEREVKVEQTQHSMDLEIESASNRARAEALEDATKNTHSFLDKVLAHGEFLQLPAVTNNNSFAGKGPNF